MNEVYFVLHRGEDDVRHAFMPKEILEQWLVRDFKGYTFIERLPPLERFPEKSVFIFKGQVVIPKPEEVVVKFTI